MARIPLTKSASGRMLDKKPPKPNAEAVKATFDRLDAQLHGKQLSSTDDQSVSMATANSKRHSNLNISNYALPSDAAAPATQPKRTQPATKSEDAPAEYVDTQTKEERHEKRMAWFYGEAARQAENRRQMAKDEAFYDNEQYEYADAMTLEERGQKVVVYNEIAPTIDWLIGTERRSRVDFYVVAQDEDDPNQEDHPGYTSPSDDAINKTKLLKYLDDVNLAAFERSYAAEDSFKGGLGILEVGLRGDKTGIPIFVSHESWRNCLHDSRAKKDQSDARYFFRTKDIDLDVAITLFPEHEGHLRAASTAGDSASAFRGVYGINGRNTVLAV